MPICGRPTYVGVWEKAGTIELVSNGVASIGHAAGGRLLMCFIRTAVSSFGSSTGYIGAVDVICAPAVAAIVDFSPFSTNGALVLVKAPEGVDKDGPTSRSSATAG